MTTTEAFVVEVALGAGEVRSAQCTAPDRDRAVPDAPSAMALKLAGQLGQPLESDRSIVTFASEDSRPTTLSPTRPHSNETCAASLANR